MILLLLLWLMSGRTFGEYMETVSPFLIAYVVFIAAAFVICIVAAVKYLFKKK